MTKLNWMIGGSLAMVLLWAVPAQAGADVDRAKAELQGSLVAAIAVAEHQATTASTRELVATLNDAQTQLDDARTVDEVRQVAMATEQVRRNLGVIAQNDGDGAPANCVDENQNGVCDDQETQESGTTEDGEGGPGEGTTATDDNEQNTMFDEVLPGDNGGGGGGDGGGGGSSSFEGDPLASNSLADSASSSESDVLGGGSDGGNAAFDDVSANDAPPPDNTAAQAGSSTVTDPVTEDPAISPTRRATGG